MRTTLMTGYALLLLYMAGCKANRPSELKKFKDVKKAVLRDDGLYNVICLNGTVETGISIKQLEDDEVCNDDAHDSLRTQFIASCRNPRNDPLSAAFTKLKGIAGRADCAETFDELSRRETLIIFALPPSTPDALTTVEPLKYFPQLKHVGIFAQKIRDLSPLSGLTELVDLTLSYNEILDVTALKNLEKLERLNLSHNRIRDFSPVEKLPRLKELVKDGNPASGP